MEKTMIKNIEKGVPVELAGLVAYQDGKVISRTLAQTPEAGITLMAVAQGEGLATHAAGGDALAYILDGEARITVGGVESTVQTGEAIVMPYGIPHSLHADVPFKMLLVLIR